MKTAVAADRLSSVFFADIRRVVRGVMAITQPGQSLDPSAVLNEVFLRMPPSRRGFLASTADWQGRARFRAVAAAPLRIALRNYTTRRNTSPISIQLSINSDLAINSGTTYDFATVDRLLTVLAASDKALTALLELACFGGMTDREIAFVLQTSTAKARRDKEYAWNWLSKRMADETRARDYNLLR